MTKEELDGLVKQYREFHRQRAEKKLKEVYEPKLKAGVTYFDEFAFDMKGEPNDKRRKDDLCSGL